MSIDKSDETELTRAQHQNHSTPFLSHLQEKLISCSKSIETGDFRQSEDSVNAFVDLLESVCETALSDPDDNGVSKANALEVLAEIHRFISSPSSNQMVVDAISLELPKAVAKFAGVSDKCKEVSESIIDVLVSISNPRDMLSILCEALDSLSKVFEAPVYFVPLLGGIPKVFPSIRRHHFEQVKVAVPVILNVLKAVSSESDDEVKNFLKDLISRVISIADSIQAVCEKLVERRKEELNALLGLYILQIMALISSSCLAEKVSSCIFFVQQLSHFLPFCGLSYLGLITGCDVDRIINMVSGAM